MDQEEPTIHQKPQASWGQTVQYDLQEIAELVAKYPSLREQLEVLAQLWEHHILRPFRGPQLRVALIAWRCLRTGYSEPLTRAITDYLTGVGTLEQLDQPWPEAGKNKEDVLWLMITSGSSSPSRALDAFDLRILDICLHQRQLALFLRAYAGHKASRHTRLQQIRDYLLSREVDIQTLLNLLADERYDTWASDEEGNLTPLGDLIRPFIAAHLDRVDAEAAAHHHRASLIQLLLAGPAPMLDLAWNIAQRGGKGYAEASNLYARLRGPAYYYWALGEHMARLLKADQARFTPLARYLAGKTSPEYPRDPEWPGSPWEQCGRLAALQALLAHDPAQHIDLAVEAFRAPGDSWIDERLRHLGLTAAYALDPVRYFPLVEEAALCTDQHLGELAVAFLSDASFEQALPALQRCVAQGQPAARLKALKVLLSQPWEGQADCARPQVTDRFVPIRNLATQWLHVHDELITEHIVPGAMVDTSWQRIETWLGVHAPDMVDLLAPGATDEDLRVLEATLGFTLPEGLTTFLQRHNGTTGNLVHSWQFLSTTEIAQEWQFWIDLDRRNKQRLQEINEQFEGYQAWHQAYAVEYLSEEDRWNPQWIPLAGNGRGDFLCVDLAGGSCYGAPLAEGQSGQVFEFIHDDTVNPWRAPSLVDLWSDLASDLEAGKYALGMVGGLQSNDAPF